MFLFSDEVYRFLEHDAPPLSPAASLLVARDQPRRHVEGVRVGRSCASGGSRRATRSSVRASPRLKDYTTICNSAPSEILALIGLRARDALLARVRDIIASNLSILDDFFERNAERFTWVRPRASSVGFPKLIARRRRRLRGPARRQRRRSDPPGVAIRLSRKPLSAGLRPARHG